MKDVQGYMRSLEVLRRIISQRNIDKDELRTTYNNLAAAENLGVADAALASAVLAVEQGTRGADPVDVRAAREFERIKSILLDS